jgi:sugar phosphate isomerase/epimerase
MIFGYSTNAFVKYSLEESIRKIARLGFKGIEIMGDRPHLYPPDYSEEKLDHIKALLKQNQLKVNNINSFTLFAVGDTYLPSWIEPRRKDEKFASNILSNPFRWQKHLIVQIFQFRRGALSKKT